MEYFFIGVVVFLFVLAIFDLSVGVSNDAVNFLNSAVGSKTASLKVLMIITSIGVFAGCVLSNGMMDIARHGIFQPQFFSFMEILCIMMTVTVTDVVLLDAFNNKGMPTSTTVSVVFELLGGTVAISMLKMLGARGTISVEQLNGMAIDGATNVGYAELINTDKALTVVLGIFVSIGIAFIFGMLIQWITRLLFTFNYKRNLKYFAGIFGGIAVTAILYFLIIKGLKDAAFMTKDVKAWINENTGMLVLYTFLASSVLMQILHWCKVNVLKIIVLLGTLSLAMAFAGNDLVNFVGVPFASLDALRDYLANGTSVGADSYMMTILASSAKTNTLFLIASGLVMVIALTTSKKAHNVVKTSVNLSSQNESDQSFGSSAISRRMVQMGNQFSAWLERVTPVKVQKWVESRFDKDELILENGAAFDQLRAAVNLVTSAMLIALGTSLKLPLSTTFVTFTVAMGASLMDRAWDRESAVFRVTGMMSVMGGWLLTAVIAFVAAFLIAMVMYFGGVVAMIALASLALFIIIKSNLKFNKENKKAKEAKTDEFSAIMDSNDEAEIWALLKSHVQKNMSHHIAYVSDTYAALIDNILKENPKALKRLQASIKDEAGTLKSIRRKEHLALKRTDPLISLQASTWFYLTVNNSSQMLYGLKRIVEPCREHVENNFNSLPKECVAELRPLEQTLLGLMKTSEDYISTYNPETSDSPAYIIRELSTFKQDVSKAMENNMIRFRSEKTSSNLNVYMMYQTILQESQQLADSTKHLLRAYAKLSSVK